MYFTSFPDGQEGWLGVIKTKARSVIQSLGNNTPETNEAYQDDDTQQIPIIIAYDDFHQSLVDTVGVVEEIPISLLNQVDLEEEAEDIELMSDTEDEEEEELLDQYIEEEERLEQAEEDDNDETCGETDSD